MQLIGSIPEEIGTMPALRELELDGNHLTGRIPATFRCAHESFIMRSYPLTRLSVVENGTNGIVLCAHPLCGVAWKVFHTVCYIDWSEQVCVAGGLFLSLVSVETSTIPIRVLGLEEMRDCCIETGGYLAS